MNNARIFRSTAALALALAVSLAAGCRPPAPTETRFPGVRVQVDDSGRATIHLHETEIVVAPEVRFATDYATAQPFRFRIEGRALELAGGALRIGELDYGSVPAGASVSIIRDGVYVEQERRGPLPGTTVER